MPVNHMHYIKCAVNSSLLTLLWLLQKVCGTLDPCFITAHSIHKEGDLQLYEGNSISKLQNQVATYIFELSAGNCHR